MKTMTIPEYPKYLATEAGYVVNRVTGGILKGIPNTIDKRLRVCMPTTNGRFRYKSVHRLVYTAFHPAVSLQPQDIVHHKDGNFLNNTPENLVLFEKGAGEHRRLHFKEEKARNQFANAKLTIQQVRGICDRLKAGGSVSAIAHEYGCLKATVYSIKAGKQWKAISEDCFTDIL